MMVTTEWEPVIGLEVHAQLSTASKMFCGCSAHYEGSPPNTHTCAVCSGMPGALPVINRRAVEYTIATALTLDCRVEEPSKFDRKNYSYPDLPKGYQISQYDMPIGQGGCVRYRVGGEILECRIRRVHLEEDTGKSMHLTMDGREVSLVDYNRSGVPLMEIVSEPDIHSPEAAREYFAALRQILMYLGVCDGNLQEGSMRADVNVSLRRADGVAGTKVEIKNLNSFRAVQRALEYEVRRQAEVYSSGGSVVHETRGWLEKDEVTVSQRTKEYAHDYRYFPEPDLPSLHMLNDQVASLRDALPEMPLARSLRFQRDLKLPAEIADVLTAEKELADFFEAVLRAAPDVDAAAVANWITGEVLRLVHELDIAIEGGRVTPAALGELLTMLQRGTINGPTAKHVLAEMFRSGAAPAAIVEHEDLGQIQSDEKLEQLVNEVLSASQNLVASYRAGKTKVFEALVGKVMGASKGKANPQRVREMLESKLSAG